MKIHIKTQLHWYRYVVEVLLWVLTPPSLLWALELRTQPRPGQRNHIYALIKCINVQNSTVQ